jgi:hypothetical protein
VLKQSASFSTWPFIWFEEARLKGLGVRAGSLFYFQRRAWQRDYATSDSLSRESFTNRSAASTFGG